MNFISIQPCHGDLYIVLLTAGLEISETWALLLTAEEIGQVLGGN
jgi:hypothetical protein